MKLILQSNQLARKTKIVAVEKSLVSNTNPSKIVTPPPPPQNRYFTKSELNEVLTDYARTIMCAISKSAGFPVFWSLAAISRIFSVCGSFRRDILPAQWMHIICNPDAHALLLRNDILCIVT